jgi:ubiquinone/menaquinone biosynthesis C-methylase UbiE
VSDVWSDWLLHRRHADDEAYAAVVRTSVERIADRVLDGARLAPGMTLADIGSGEGLVAFRAIERVGASLQVILSDVSAPMLEHAESLARERRVEQQCRFVECPADALLGIADASVDVVTSRAVLAYVADKAKALREWFRILKPGGRIAAAEPVLQDEAFYVRALRARLDALAPGSDDRFLRLLHRWKAAQFPDTAEACARSPIVNYSERDLLNLTRAAGFAEIHLELHLDVMPSLVTTWQVFLGTSPHPWAPSLSAIMAEQFSADERQFFEQMVRPTIESGDNLVVDRIAYLNAIKPWAR